jgi:hypothetical protein
MAVGLRVHHNRKVYFKSVFSGHCYFEAQALSNPLTAGMPTKTGARLTRLLYLHMYGGNMEILWPLRTWIRPIVKYQKPPEFTVENAGDADTAEREAALALRRPLIEEHWAWREEDLFAVRSRMVPFCGNATPIWTPMYTHSSRFVHLL